MLEQAVELKHYSHLAAAQVLEVLKPCGIGGPDAQHFVKLVVRNRRRERPASRGSIFDAAEADICVAAVNRLVDRREGHVHEPRWSAQRAGNQASDVHIEADEFVRMDRAGFNEGRAPFRIASPHEIWRSGGTLAASCASGPGALWFAGHRMRTAARDQCHGQKS